MVTYHYYKKGNNEFKILSNKQSIEEVSIERAVKTSIQILYDKGLFLSFPNADKVSKDFLFVTKRRLDLEKVNDVVIQ